MSAKVFALKDSIVRRFDSLIVQREACLYPECLMVRRSIIAADVTIVRIVSGWLLKLTRRDPQPIFYSFEGLSNE